MMRDFWYNGHHCEVRRVSRDEYVSSIDGERISYGTNPKDLSEELIAKARYRPSVEPDFDAVAESVLRFVHENGSDETWVTADTLEEYVVMINYGLLLDVVHALSNAGYIRVNRLYNGDYIAKPIGEMPELIDIDSTFDTKQKWIQ